jgi:CBS domain-containing protein
VRHLGVTDDIGTVVGALSARDLLRLRAEAGVLLGDHIDQAADASSLARAWGTLAQVAAGLAREGLSGREVAAVISRELGAMTHRAAVLAEQRMIAAGRGGAPCPYAFAVLGSAGRGESLLAMDQDNAIVFAEGEPDGPQDRWFATLGAHVADILHEAGVPYCTGGVMAKNAPWRGSLATWQARVRGWIRHANPQDLLSVDIFFDWRGVHGDAALAAALRQESLDLAAGEVAFAKLLADTAGTVAPALNWFGGFIAEAQGIFLDLILAQQIRDIGAGIRPGNAVETKRLPRRERQRLLAALKAVANLDTLTRELLFRA